MKGRSYLGLNLALAGILLGLAAAPTAHALGAAIDPIARAMANAASVALTNATNITTGTLAVARGGTGATTTTGSGANVLATSPALVTPALGVPSALTLTNATGLPIAGITGVGTGVATALAANVTGSGGIALATSPVFTTPTLGAATVTTLTSSATCIGVGGATSGSPGFKKVGAVLQTCLADNSANSDFQAASITGSSLTSQGIIGHGVYAVASLPTCNSGTDGARASVNNATVAASGNFGAVVAGSGANHVPVYCDATSWKIG